MTMANAFLHREYALRWKANIQTLEEMRAALDRWMKDTGDLGAVPEVELVKRGLVADRIKEYEDRKKNGLQPNERRQPLKQP